MTGSLNHLFDQSLLWKIMFPFIYWYNFVFRKKIFFYFLCFISFSILLGNCVEINFIELFYFQIINLLTIDELMITLPKQIIIPRTFLIQPNQSLFIGGLGRLDYVSGEQKLK